MAGYINLADGEKDPRNLMLAFAIARVLLIEFDVSSHIEVWPLRMLRESAVTEAILSGSLQHHILLLPHYIQATS